MADTLRGGQGLIGHISRAERLALSDKCRKEHAADLIDFLKKCAENPLCSYNERTRAAEAVLKIIAQGDSIAMKMAEEERIDAGKNTTAEKITVRITFDDAG
jgi:hypothetical protein